MDICLGDILVMKKSHPCGEKRWQVLRVKTANTESGITAEQRQAA